MMAEREPDGWEVVTREGHERQRLLDMMRLPLEAKLDWLEDAQRLVEQIAGKLGPGGREPQGRSAKD